MPTFDNGEGGLSVRTKINNAITKVDGMEEGATADQTGAEIKALYEAESDTNAFTDADHSKLDGIESGATADQSDAEIKTAYENNANTNAFTDSEQTKLAGIEASADVTDTANVTAAGAVMDSELTNEAAVKAINQGLATTDSPTFGTLYIEDGSAATPSLSNTGDTDTGVFFPAADTVAVSVGGTEGFRLTSTGLGVGTSSPFADFHVQGAAPEFRMYSSNTTGGLINFIDQGWQSQIQGSGGHLMFMAGGATEGMRLTSGRDLVVGATAEGTDGSVALNNNGYVHAKRSEIVGYFDRTSTHGTAIEVRKDGSAVAVIGTQNSGFGIASPLAAGHFRGSGVVDGGLSGVVYVDDDAAYNAWPAAGITFRGQYNSSGDYGNFGGIVVGKENLTDGQYGSYLDLVTRAHGASPATAVRIDSGKNVLVGKTSSSISTAGFQANAGGDTYHVVDGNVCMYVNRLTSDGDLIQLRQAGVTEGSISVSGTTVSYNGAHLSRWFQTPGADHSNIEDRPEILRGSVLSNLDEMCDWGNEDNEQLNKMEVSSVKGDRNVAGVFQGWDDDDAEYLNDGYCAMTGDFVVRIAKGCTVQRGDLLMSAGDGTACPQEGELADVVRSCTVAKVTSTTVSHTYADGSYLLPCVLMAC